MNSAQALGSLAHRTLSREDSLAFSASAVRHILRGKSAGYDAIADDAATLLLARTAPALAAGGAAAVDVDDLADRVERLTNADGAARRVLETVATHARTCLGSNADRPGRYALALALDRAAKGCEIPNVKGSYLGRFPLVSADFWTSDHLSERSRSVDAFSGTRARGTLTLKRR